MADDKPVFDGAFWEEAAVLTEELVDAGADEEKALDAIAEFLDTVIPLDVIIPGPMGKAAEVADGPLIRKGVGEIAEWLKALLKGDPEKRAERKARRAERKAARQARRDARRAEKEA